MGTANVSSLSSSSASTIDQPNAVPMPSPRMVPLALRRAGAGRLPTILVGISSVFAVHPPPVGLACFAMRERSSRSEGFDACCTHDWAPLVDPTRPTRMVAEFAA